MSAEIMVRAPLREEP
jgi:hypothetical protein